MKLLTFGATASVAGLLAVSGISTISNASPWLEGHKSQIVVAQNSNTTQLSGSFVAAEAPTTGMARIVEENGQKYLEVSAFGTTDQAPDLQVLLDTVAQPPANYQDAELNRYLNLGGLQSVTGEQRYPIPEFVDASQFKSVVIWCRMANATIGYASLANDSSASIR